MEKNFVHGSLVVNFLSGPPEDSHYSVYDRATHKDARICKTPNGIRGIGRAATVAEVEAVNAFRDAEAAAFQVWLEAHPECKQYA